MPERKIHCVIHGEGGHFVAQCLNTGVASQGDTYAEAVRNVREAVELYLEGEDDALYTPVHSVTVVEQVING